MTPNSAVLSLKGLPAELQSLILHTLPLPTLLTFALTSRHNYELARSTLSTLNLAVFPKRIHGVLAFLNTNESTFLDEDKSSTRYQIVMPTVQKADREQQKEAETRSKKDAALQPPPSVQRLHTIQDQNARLEHVLSSSILSDLSTLTIHTYALLSSTLGLAMAQNFPHLRHLTLNFSHPCIHDTSLPARYWTTCPDTSKEGSPAWNALGSLGDEYAGVVNMKSLQTLTVTRAAITSVQLTKWVGMNQDLQEIYLDMVAGVDQAFVESLMDLRAGQRNRVPLTVLSLKRCPQLHLQKPADFEWIQGMLAMGLEEVDFSECDGVDSDVLRRSCQARGWTSRDGLKVTCPDSVLEGRRSLDGQDLVPEQESQEMKWRNDLGAGFSTERIEVDPAYIAIR